MFSASDSRYVQFGCGLSAPVQWLNFDASPSLQLQRLPLLGGLVPAGPFGRFPENVAYGDIVKGLPVLDGSVQLFYCSHVLEHLSLNEFRLALKNCRRHLQPDGIFRLVVPDLEYMVKKYLGAKPNPEAAHEFMKTTYLGKEDRPRSLLNFIRDWLGGSHHLWLYDYDSLSWELRQAGFKNIRRAQLGDSGIDLFNEVENPDRWNLELGIQCS